MENITYLVVAILVVIAAIFDIKKKKIPNKLTLPFILIGIIFNTTAYGLTGTVSSALGILVGFAWIILFAFGVIGAGDIKLFMAIGAFLGAKLCIMSIMISFLCGGIAGIFVLWIRKNGKKRLRNLYVYLSVLAITKKVSQYEVIDKQNDAYFSLGACIAVGTIITIILNYNGITLDFLCS